MKILLINPPVFLNGKQVLEYSQEPFTLLSLAAFLKKNRYHVEIIDFLVEEYEPQALKIRVNNIEVVGISVSSRTRNSALDVARSIKENSDALIITGGPHATVNPHDLLRDKTIDIVIRGEGEETLLEVLRKREKGEKNFGDIAGIAFLSGEHICLTKDRDFIRDLDKLPWPDRGIIDYNLYRKRFWGLRTFSLMAGRGCPYKCIFCSQVNGRVARWRSPENVIAEIKSLIEQFGIRSFIFMDDTFTVNRKWLEHFLESLEKEKLLIYYKINGRINNMTPALLKRMKNTGLRAITFGIESGDEGILKRIGKDLKLDEARKVCQWADEAELEVICNFMVGFPFEDILSIKKTIMFASSLPISFLNQSLVTPFPGTELFGELSEEEKGAFNYDKLNTFVDPFKARRISDFDQTIIMKNGNLTREDIINKFIMLRLYFFKKRILRELRETVKRLKRFFKYIFREPFLIALALSFPALRSFTVAIFLRIFKSGKAVKEDLIFFGKMIRFMIHSEAYLDGDKKFLNK